MSDPRGKHCATCTCRIIDERASLTLRQRLLLRGVFLLLLLFVAGCPATAPDGSLCPQGSNVRDVTLYAGETVIRRYDGACFRVGVPSYNSALACASIWSAESGYVTFCGTFVATEPKK